MTTFSPVDAYWLDRATDLVDWIKTPTQGGAVSFHTPVSIRWFQDGILNVTTTCVDRHAAATPDRVAFFYEGEDEAQRQTITYRQLKDEVCRFANSLKALGVAKGDRVVIYMPMIPQAVYAMLACARIGAVHSVVFGGFSAHALHTRIMDCGAKVIITADGGMRGGKGIALKAAVDEAIPETLVQHVVVVRHLGQDIPWAAGRDHDYADLQKAASPICDPEPMKAEDPLFILYTSGSTGTPKGVLHTCGGYLVYAAHTMQTVFGAKETDVFWCTADVGWITGHSYIVYGPLSMGTTQVLFEGVPTWPNASRWWQMVDRYGVTIFYTAPTAIRTLMRLGLDPLNTTHRSTLRLLGSVGEPIDPEAWHWYHTHIGGGRCPIMDTGWQTETGGILMAPLDQNNQKPGFAAKALPHIQPVLLDTHGQPTQDEGNLCFATSWPGQARTLYGDHARFEKTYFGDFPGFYVSGDGAKRDANGDYRITGRVDDVINVSGHRLSTAEIEAALDDAHGVIESAVVGSPDPLKGQGIYAFVVLASGVIASDALKKDLMDHVRTYISPIAKPDHIQFCDGLPKTRSGKIMRRILRKIAAGESDFGDISTLANPEVVAVLRGGGGSDS